MTSFAKEESRSSSAEAARGSLWNSLRSRLNTLTSTLYLSYIITFTSMASRRAIVSGLSRLIRQGGASLSANAGVSASTATDAVVATRSVLPAMFQSGRGFAAEPAAAASTQMGKVTQVRTGDDASFGDGGG